MSNDTSADPRRPAPVSPSPPGGTEASGSQTSGSRAGSSPASSSPASSSPASGSRAVRPGLLALGTFTAGTDAFLVSGVLPAVARDLHVSLGAAGQSVTVFALVYAVGSPLLAALTGRLDRRVVMVTGMALLAVANAACAVVPTLGGLLAARVVAGLGAAQFTPNAASAVVAGTPPERRGRALAVLLAGMSAGTVLGLPAGTVLAGQAGWRAAFWLVAALSLVAAGVLAAGMPAVRLPRTDWRDRVRPLRDRSVARLLLVTMTIMIGPYATMTYIAPVTAPATGSGATALAVLLMLNGIAATIGSALAGRLVDRIGPRAVLAGQLVVLAGSLAGLGAGRRSAVATALCMALWGLAGFGTMVAQQHRLARLAGASAPLVMGLNGSAIYLGSVLGASVGAGVLERAGVAWLPVASAAVVAVALAMVLSGDAGDAGHVGDGPAEPVRRSSAARSPGSPR